MVRSVVVLYPATFPLPLERGLECDFFLPEMKPYRTTLPTRSRKNGW
jgi:hypothetical protein